MSIDYSIIIPAFNEENYLLATLEAVEKAMRENQEYTGELIVVDNNSSDRTAEIAENAGAKVVFEPVNQISRARNAGGRQATGRFLVFLDADSIISPELLGAVLRNLDSGKICGGGAKVAFDRPTPFWTKWVIEVFARSHTAAGCLVYSRRDAFDAVGGFSEKVYASEEVGFTRLIKKWGRKRNMKFRVVSEFPVVSSARKMDQMSPLKMIFYLLFLGICPFALRSKSLCYMWYRVR